MVAALLTQKGCAPGEPVIVRSGFRGRVLCKRLNVNRHGTETNRKPRTADADRISTLKSKPRAAFRSGGETLVIVPGFINRRGKASRRDPAPRQARTTTMPRNRRGRQQQPITGRDGSHQPHDDKPTWQGHQHTHSQGAQHGSAHDRHGEGRRQKPGRPEKGLSYWKPSSRDLASQNVHSPRATMQSDHGWTSLGPCANHARAQKIADNSPLMASWVCAPTKRRGESASITTHPAVQPRTWTRSAVQPMTRKAQLLRTPSKEPSVKTSSLSQQECRPPASGGGRPPRPGAGQG